MKRILLSLVAVVAVAASAQVVDISGEYAAKSTTNYPLNFSANVSIQKTEVENEYKVTGFTTYHATAVTGVYHPETSKFVVAAGQKVNKHPTYGDVRLYALSDETSYLPTTDIVFNVKPDGSMELVQYGMILLLPDNNYMGDIPMKYYTLYPCNGTMTNDKVNQDMTRVDFGPYTITNTYTEFTPTGGVVYGIDKKVYISFTIGEDNEVTFSNTDNATLYNTSYTYSHMTACDTTAAFIWHVLDKPVKGVIDYKAGTITIGPWAFISTHKSLPGASTRFNGFKAGSVITFPPVGVKGDVNGDDKVDVADVNAIIDIILELQESKAVADVNGDGKVDVADVNEVIDTILAM